jgi:hypothetical protein
LGFPVFPVLTWEKNVEEGSILPNPPNCLSSLSSTTCSYSHRCGREEPYETPYVRRKKKYKIRKCIVYTTVDKKTKILF